MTEQPDDLFRSRRMLIDGNLVKSSGRQWIMSVNPATEMPIGKVPLGNAVDVDAATEAAIRAQKQWKTTAISTRAALINKIADAIEARSEEIAQLETRDTGNTLGPMRRDVSVAVERMRLAAGLGYELKGETIPASPGGLHFTRRVPYGVIGRIIPFNHPIGFAASRLAPALMAGNSIIIKPSEQSPLSACILAEICAELAPPGLINIVTGDAATGRAIARHPKIKRLAFIGSVATGMGIQRDAAEVAVKHVTLELGGKNPMIICPDANLDAAAAAAVRGMNFGWQGQSCGSTSRLMLHDDIYDTVLEKVLARIADIRIGDPLDETTTMGPMNSVQQYEKTKQYIDLAKDEGARLLTGGTPPEGPAFKKGFWVSPTVFGDVDMSMRIAREEVFGPVLSVLRWNSYDQAVSMANDVDYGLTASIWTRDLQQAMDFSNDIEAGYIWINGTGTHFRNVPYGGLKNSGVSREEGLDELLSYTEVQAVNFVAPAP